MPLMLNSEQQLYLEALKQMDVEGMVQFSTVNHHVEGMDYICLHRAPGLTMKVYLIEEPINPNGGYLVSPHDHRYPFYSTVLNGSLRHHRFAVRKDIDCYEHLPLYTQMRYNPDLRVQGGKPEEFFDAHRLVRLETIEAKVHRAGDEAYFVSPHEIHTLEMINVATPTLIGLMQLNDVHKYSLLYANGPIQFAEERRPSLSELKTLRDRAISLLED